jgi:nitroreductase
VPKELLEQIIEAGRSAPSGQNLQPWHFFVVKDIERNKAIGRKIQPVLEQKVPSYKGTPERDGVSNTLFYDPPVVIYCAIKKMDIDTTQFDLGLALGYMMLMAQKLGLHSLPVAMSRWFGGDIIKAELGIPDTEEFYLSLSVGYADPATTITPRPRNPADQVATFM